MSEVVPCVHYLETHAAAWPTLQDDYAADAMHAYFADVQGCRIAYVYRDYQMLSHGEDIMTLSEAITKLTKRHPHRAHVYHAASSLVELYESCTYDEMLDLGW